MRDKQDVKLPGRRAFFRAAGTGLGAAGAMAVGLSAVPDEAAADEPRDRSDSRYRETEHVRKAYDTARF